MDADLLGLIVFCLSPFGAIYLIIREIWANRPLTHPPRMVQSFADTHTSQDRAVMRGWVQG
jgi:hypothetical protein